jgi:hypothetical protein
VLVVVVSVLVVVDSPLIASPGVDSVVVVVDSVVVVPSVVELAHPKSMAPRANTIRYFFIEFAPLKVRAHDDTQCKRIRPFALRINPESIIPERLLGTIAHRFQAGQPPVL